MQAPSPNINSFSDLLDMVEHRLAVPSIILAQSMGGVLAIQLALKRPELVTELVLVATSGGLDVSAFGASDWRPEFLAAYPNTASWLFSEKTDLTSKFEELAVPTLLIWGDADPISPVAVGRHLASLIPRSELAVISGGDHSMAAELPHLVAPLIEAHILKTDIS
jgi:pimeloyl-ACP methyl ester carboxylesterase